MSEIIVFIVTGITAGAVYSLAGVGLVLTYRTSGVLNFGQGAVATVSAYLFYTLHVQHGIPWPIAALVSVVGVGVTIGLAMELIARRLQGSALAVSVACTVGMLLLIEAAVDLIYGTDAVRQVPVFFKSGGFTLAGAPTQWSDVITVSIAVALTAGLSALLKFTRLGMATRAVVEDAELLDSSGLNPASVRRVAWILGSSLAAVSGVLFASLLPLSSVQLTLLVVSAFGAAAIGGFRSLSMTFIGGLVIGVLASLATKYFTTGLLAGVPPSMPFLVLFLVLLVAPKRYFANTTSAIPRRSPWVTPLPVQLPLLAVAVGVLALVPAIAGIHLTAWTTGLGTTIIFLSLGLLVRTSGQVSLCQVSFAAIGAAGFSHLITGGHLPWLLALVIVGLIAVPIGALLAIPAIRLSGLYLALATFGFGILLQYMFYTQHYMFGANDAGLVEPRPSFARGDNAYYYLVLGFVALAAIAIIVVERARLGRLLRAMSDSTTTLQTTGTAVNVTRVLVFSLAAFLAAVGGALVAVGQNVVSAESYSPLRSLTFLTLGVIVLLGAPWNAIVAALALAVVPSYITGAETATWLQLIFGVNAVLIAFVPNGGGAGDRLRRIIDNRFDRRRTGPKTSGERPRLRAVPTKANRGLEITDLRVRFGGNIAVDDVTLRVPAGTITGLIGPNGAGKTTTFNACSGLLKPTTGTVRLDGRDVARMGPAGRARRGLGRTFQRMQLFDSLTTRENVAIGCEGGFAGRNPVRHLVSSRVNRRTVDHAAQDAMELCGIADLADRQVGSLSTGQRRLVDLARCLAGHPDVLLLDEPSSGLDHDESRQLADVLRRTVDDRGVAILLVEHDLSLVLGLCERIYVLDFGHLIFVGTPGEVSDSPLVHAAYLGAPEVEEAIESPAADGGLDSQVTVA
jgi:ABC-type branched-subunit amino acid transport system ATPase component/branched-subunit amino acid ABC-type transport system permease component